MGLERLAARRLERELRGEERERAARLERCEARARLEVREDLG